MPVNDPLFNDMPVDLRDLISKPIGDLELNTLLPTCYYFGECVDVLTGLSTNKGTRYFAFICQPKEVCTLDDAGKAAAQQLNGVNLTDYEFPRRDQVGKGLPAGQIWWTPKSQGMVREFMTDMGFPESKPVDECIVGMRGRKVLMGIGKDSYQKDPNSKPREYNVLVSLAQDPR